jgi:hypothetical protein
MKYGVEMASAGSFVKTNGGVQKLSGDDTYTEGGLTFTFSVTFFS